VLQKIVGWPSLCQTSNAVSYQVKVHVDDFGVSATFDATNANGCHTPHIYTALAHAHAHAPSTPTGVPVLITDTAGIRDGPDVGEIEREGIRRAVVAADQADIRVHVYDSTTAPADDHNHAAFDFDQHSDGDACGDGAAHPRVRSTGSPRLVVWNKVDAVSTLLSPSLPLQRRDAGLDQTGRTLDTLPPTASLPPPDHKISCVTGEGIAELLGALEVLVHDMTAGAVTEDAALCNARHRAHLEDCTAGQVTTRARRVLHYRHLFSGVCLL
jgi:tRNA U34 5-carboxymethylaminomethyl modifying GTPase MnmE/TrmE